MKSRMNFLRFMSVTISLISLFLLTTDSHAENKTENKIVYLISPPRSLSVAFLRMMEARGDFTTMNEPSQWAYNVIENYEMAKPWFKNDAPQTFDEVKQIIFKKAESSNVFVKEISFAVKDFLLNDTDLTQRKNVYFVFLIRNPHHSVISFYKKQQKVCSDVESKTFSNIIGYKQHYEVFTHIKQNATNAPYVVLSEDLYTSPKETLAKLCDFLKLPFKETALQWSSLSDDFLGETWHEIKPKHIMHTWHDDAIKSSGFKKPTNYKLDDKGTPTFEEIANAEHRKICMSVYAESLQFYTKILLAMHN